MGNQKSDIVKSFRQRRKILLVEVLGGKCCICGYSKSVAALEFHHLDAKTKEFQLSSGNCRKLEEDLNEARKCILLCANCHREVHNESFHDLENMSPSFNEELAKEALGKLETKVYVCKVCKTVIGSDTKNDLCKKCQSESRRVCERPSREELKILIREKTFVEIAKTYQVSDNAIRKWCTSVGLPHSKTLIKSYTEEQWSTI